MLRRDEVAREQLVGAGDDPSDPLLDRDAELVGETHRRMRLVTAARHVTELADRRHEPASRQQLVEALDDVNQRNAAELFYDTLVDDLSDFGLWALIVAAIAAVAIYLFDHFYMQKKVNEPDTAI